MIRTHLREHVLHYYPKLVERFDGLLPKLDAALPVDERDAVLALVAQLLSERVEIELRETQRAEWERFRRDHLEAAMAWLVEGVALFGLTRGPDGVLVRAGWLPEQLEGLARELAQLDPETATEPMRRYYRELLGALDGPVSAPERSLTLAPPIVECARQIDAALAPHVAEELPRYELVADIFNAVAPRGLTGDEAPHGFAGRQPGELWKWWTIKRMLDTTAA